MILQAVADEDEGGPVVGMAEACGVDELLLGVAEGLGFGLALAEGGVELVHEGGGGAVVYGPEGSDRSSGSGLLYLKAESQQFFAVAFFAEGGLAGAKDDEVDVG